MKTNIILGALGILSILGGLFAYKAQHRFGGIYLCYTTVGIPVGFTNRFYKAILTTRYTIIDTGTTLFCAIPTANGKYIPVKVEEQL